MSQEKLQTMIMQIIFFLEGGGGVEEVHYGFCASRESLCSLVTNRHVLKIFFD